MYRAVLLYTAVMIGSSGQAIAQAADTLPAGVTAARIEAGKALYHGAAICVACHGPNGDGIRGVGPALGDAEWLHSDGSYEAIVAQIRAGVSSEASTSGIMMPPNGGANLTDEQVRAVAAYVWSLRRQTN